MEDLINPMGVVLQQHGCLTQGIRDSASSARINTGRIGRDIHRWILTCETGGLEDHQLDPTTSTKNHYKDTTLSSLNCPPKLFERKSPKHPFKLVVWGSRCDFYHLFNPFHIHPRIQP